MNDGRVKSGDFFCVGHNHRTANISVRETLYLTPEQVETALVATSKKFNISELAILSTCNRCEVFGLVSEKNSVSADFLCEVYAYIHESVSSKSNIDPSMLSQTLYTATGVDAVRHTFHVASSLDSLVLGETQITGQFKDAIALAQKVGTLGTMLGRLSQEALGAAKKIRTETEIGRHRVSISHAAIDLARRASPDLSKLNFLILGAGEMARVAAEYAASYKPRRLVIANRNKAKAAILVEQLNFGEAQDHSLLSSLIAHADVVISATSASECIVMKYDIIMALKVRDSSRMGPLFLIDIALPRDIDPKCGELDDVYLFDIDDLKSVVNAHMDKRREAVLEAEHIITERVSNFSQWLGLQKIGPTLSASSKYFSDIMTKESQKTFSRDNFSGLNHQQRKAIDAMFDAIASRITSDIAKTLRHADHQTSPLMTAALQALFDKDPSP